MTHSIGATPWTPTSSLAKLVWAVGFSYDPGQDIIFSRMDAWQRSLGYCWAYDMAAPTLGMIIDAEPLYFTYKGKQWMIELWKGQYGLESGGEIGVYNRTEHFWLPSNSGLFACADDADRLLMSFTLHRNGQTLLTRGPERHWWLTGFRWGVFSEPEGITMTASITLRDKEMCNAFRGALTTCGYSGISVDKTTVKFTFAKPFTGQPVARGLARGRVQPSNQSLVAAYDAAKRDAGLTSNDPNIITEEAFPAVYEKIKEWLTSWHAWGPAR
jgi:hypothetical protein